MSKRAVEKYGVFLVYGLAAALCAFAMYGCRGIQGGVIGAGTGAAVTGTPQGAGIGAVSGFVVGVWNDLTAAISGWWAGMWHHEPIPPPSTGAWTWALLVALVLFFVKFVYHFTWDGDFRDHIFKFVGTLLHPKPKRKSNASA